MGACVFVLNICETHWKHMRDDSSPWFLLDFVSNFHEICRNAMFSDAFVVNVCCCVELFSHWIRLTWHLFHLCRFRCSPFFPHSMPMPPHPVTIRELITIKADVYTIGFSFEVNWNLSPAIVCVHNLCEFVKLANAQLSHACIHTHTLTNLRVSEIFECSLHSHIITGERISIH